MESNSLGQNGKKTKNSVEDVFLIHWPSSVQCCHAERKPKHTKKIFIELQYATGC